MDSQTVIKSETVDSAINKPLGIRDLYVSLLIAILTFAWFGYWSLIGVDSHHDGIMLKPAMDVAGGQMVFRNTFTQYGMLSVLIPACVLHFCGKLIALKLLVVGFYAGCAVFLYLLSRKVLRTGFTWIPVSLMFVLAPCYFWTFHAWSSVIALFFSLGLNYVLIVFMERSFLKQEIEQDAQNSSKTQVQHADRITSTENIDYIDETENTDSIESTDSTGSTDSTDNTVGVTIEWGWVGIGVLSTVPFWCRQPTGLVVPSLVILLFLLHWKYQDGFSKTLKRLLYYLIGVLMGFTVVIGWLASNHAVRDFVLQSLRFAARFASDRTTGSIRVFNRINYPIDQFLFGLFFILVFIWFFYLCWRIFVRKDMKLTDWYFLSVVLLSGAALHQYFPVPCIRHLYWGALPAFIVYARFIQSVWDYKRIARPAALFTVAVLLAIPIGRLAYHLEHNPRQFNTWHKLSELSTLETYTHDGVLKYMRMLPKEKEYWDNLQTAIDELPPEYANRPVVNLTKNGIPSLLFKNQKNWHPMYMNWQSIYPEFAYCQNLMLNSGQGIIIATVPQAAPETYKKYEFFKKYQIWRSVPHWQFDINTLIFIPTDQTAVKGEPNDSEASHSENETPNDDAKGQENER